MTRNLNYAFALALTAGIAGLTATPASADEGSTSVVASAADYDSGPQVYLKLGAGSATEVEAEGHFVPDFDPVEGWGDHETETFELDGGATFGAAIGIDFGYVRIEGGVDRLDAELAGGFVEFDATDWNATAFVDLPLAENVTAFGGAGLNYVEAEANLLGQGVSGDGDGWHYEVGAAYALSDAVTIEASYRNTDVGLDFDGFEVETSSQTLRAGLRFTL